jgi:hypothetical protein
MARKSTKTKKTTKTTKTTTADTTPPDPNDFDGAGKIFKQLLDERRTQATQAKKDYERAHEQATNWNGLAGNPKIDDAAKSKFIEPRRAHWAQELAAKKSAMREAESDVNHLEEINKVVAE